MIEKKYGFYSNKAANIWVQIVKEGIPINRASIYKTPQGTEVLVTAVGNHDTPQAMGYMWPDAVLVGEVTEWVRAVP